MFHSISSCANQNEQWFPKSYTKEYFADGMFYECTTRVEPGLTFCTS